MKQHFFAWVLLAVLGVVANVALAAPCPPHIYLANNTVEPNGMKGNGGRIAFDNTPIVTAATKACEYTRPDTANYDPFIGRNLNPTELAATVNSPDSWVVTLKAGGREIVTCPAGLTIGPVTMYSGTGGTMSPIPLTWHVTSGNTQTLKFDALSNQLPFLMRCNYHGVTKVIVQLP